MQTVNMAIHIYTTGLKGHALAAQAARIPAFDGGSSTWAAA